jgi:hypothetical protein
MWMATLSIIRRLNAGQDEIFRIARIIGWSLFIMGVFSIINTIINVDIKEMKFGNKYLTLFGSELTALSMLVPLFLFSVSDKSILIKLKKCTVVYLFIGLLFFILSGSYGTSNIKDSIASSAIWIPALYIFFTKKEKILIYFLIILSIYSASYENYRSSVVLTFFGVASVVLAHYIKRRIITRIFCVIFTITPFIILFYSVTMGNSFFEIMSESNISKFDLTDSRSFIFIEVADDLNQNNAWICGKGAYSRYYSDYFFYEDGDSYSRQVVEVPILSYLLRGGLIYVVLYISLLILAIWNALFYGKNKFIQSVAVIATGWIVSSFLGEINGANFLHVGFWILIGCCFSKSILRATDKDIINLMKQTIHKRHE